MNFDIIAISETWLNSDSNLSLFQIPGYDLCHIDRNDKRGGGVALYVKNCYNYKVSDQMSFAIKDNLECITIEVIFEAKKNIMVSCIYNQPASDTNTLIQTIEELYRNNRKDVYLCGDFNVNLFDYQGQEAIRDFTDTIFSLGLFPLIDKPTRITVQSATLIDNIFSNVLNVSHECGLLLADISDHLPVFCVSNYKLHSEQDNEFIFYRKKCEGSMSMFKEKLNNESWNSVYLTNNAHRSYDIFISIIKRYYNDCFPLKKVLVGNGRKDKPWVTKGLRNACKKKRNLYVKFLKRRSSESEQRYKTYKNKLNSIMTRCKKDYYTNLLQSHKNNIKETWKVLNGILNKNVNKQLKYPDTFIDKGDEVTGDAIVNGFNNFFTNIGPELAASIPDDRGNIHDFLHEPKANSMFLEHVSEVEVLEVVSNMTNKTSTDYNDLSMSFVKDIIMQILHPFTFICNSSLSIVAFSLIA